MQKSQKTTHKSPEKAENKHLFPLSAEIRKIRSKNMDKRHIETAQRAASIGAQYCSLARTARASPGQIKIHLLTALSTRGKQQSNKAKTASITGNLTLHFRKKQSTFKQKSFLFKKFVFLPRFI